LNKKFLVNNQIRAEKVRVVDETGKQLGIFSLEEAIHLAEERHLDLIQMTDRADPPVCKISDFGKLLYEQKKKAKKAKKVGELKEIRISFNISSHDLETKIKQIEKFLGEGKKIRIEMRLRGREKALQEIAKQKMKDFISMIQEKIPLKIERELKKVGQGLTIIISKS